MWCTAEKRYVPHVCLRNPFPLFLWEFQASTPCQKLELPESRVRSAISALNHGCIMLIPSLQLQKKTCHMQRSRGSGHGVVISKKCYKWTIVEIEILATVVWKRGCQPFSCRCSQNVMHCRKEICSTCLFKESIPTIPLGIPSIHSLPEAWASWEPHTFRHLCIKSRLYHAHPFVAAAEKNLSYAEKQRGLVTELWSQRIVLTYCLCSYVTAANQWTIVEIEILATVRKMWCTAERRCVGHVCSRNPCLL